jgi:hypothetical protein
MSASPIAVVRSAWALLAVVSSTYDVPLSVPGGKPVAALPGLKPKLPLIMLEPVFVIVDPASTAKLPAVPRPTDACAVFTGTAIITNSNNVSSNGINRILLSVFINLLNPLYANSLKPPLKVLFNTFRFLAKCPCRPVPQFLNCSQHL